MVAAVVVGAGVVVRGVGGGESADCASEGAVVVERSVLAIAS